jgi:hypothetical protein
MVLDSIVKEKVDKFMKEKNLEPPKCISDRILLYVRYGIDYFSSKKEFYDYMHEKRAEEYKAIYEKWGRTVYIKQFKDSVYCYLVYKLDEDDKKRLTDNCMKVYELVRGDVRYTNRNPLSVAAGIIYLAGVMLTRLKIIQHDLEGCFGLSETSVRTYYKLILKDFKRELEGLKKDTKG